MQKVAIIIPCFNEEKRLNATPLLSLLDGTDVDIYLSNDGSTDATLAVLQKITQIDATRCFVLHFEKNAGKAHTIFKSVQQILINEQYSHIGYFDADFSTPPAEIIRMINSLEDNDFFFAGSRVKLLSTKIERKWYRHVIGRIIVTLINFKFRLGVYDTQCGAKLFPISIAKVAFKAPFATSWLFDVEIFIRLRNENLLQFGKEFPLLYWKDVDGSKLSWKTAFKILQEMYILQKTY